MLLQPTTTITKKNNHEQKQSTDYKHQSTTINNQPQQSEVLPWQIVGVTDTDTHVWNERNSVGQSFSVRVRGPGVLKTIGSRGHQGNVFGQWKFMVFGKFSRSVKDFHDTGMFTRGGIILGRHVHTVFVQKGIAGLGV